jgi:hypothetical protein
VPEVDPCDRSSLVDCVSRVITAEPDESNNASRCTCSCTRLNATRDYRTKLVGQTHEQQTRRVSERDDHIRRHLLDGSLSRQANLRTDSHSIELRTNTSGMQINGTLSRPDLFSFRRDSLTIIGQCDALELESVRDMRAMLFSPVVTPICEQKT